MPTLAGTQLDKYDMLEEVGRGGMAVVYRGHDRVLKREVAVKVLHAHLSDRQESRLRLEREAIAVAKLRHENILEIFDYSGPKAEESYIVTEFIHGPTLKEWMDEEHEPRPAVAALLVHRLCLALCHAHRSGIVHRDIKPENVMIRKDDGCLKLMDFGIAQILDNQKLTLTGQLIGSPAYMAPELINGRPLDQRTDLFSLGILLYQLSTGSLPFAGRNPHEVLNRIADGHYSPAPTVCPLVDRDLEAIIDRALANNPDNRFQSVDSLAQELETYLNDMAIDASADELAAYFRSPAQYIVELDERVNKALMDRAQEAAREGHSARAIRLLGRILELAPDHPAALSLLARLRVRERRLRQLLVGLGGVAVAGLIAAAIMIPSAAEPEETTGPDPGALVALRSLHNAAPEAAQMSEQPPAQTEEPLASLDPAGLHPTAVGAGAGRVDEDNPTTVRATQTSAPKPKRQRGPRRPPSRPKVDCSVEFVGPPVGALTHLKLQVDGKRRKLKARKAQFQLSADAAKVELGGGGYQAKRNVTREQCLAGTVQIQVKVPPARLSYKNGPPKLVVRCQSGCPKEQRKRNWSPETLREIPIPSNKPFQRVTLLLKAPGYRERRIDQLLVPGNNSINASLEPR